MSAQYVQGMGYAPGIAQGVLQRGPSCGADAIAVVTQAGLAGFAARPAGIVVVDGAPFSHTLIRLLGLGVPTIIAAAADVAGIPDGTRVRIDGWRGSLSAAVDAAVPGAPPVPVSGQPVFSADGVAVSLRASVRGVDAVGRARAQGAAAIGLVRTEFLEPGGGRVPDATFYARMFAELCAHAHPLTVTFRLLDIAADKRPDWLHLPSALLGSLGLQGVRLFGRPQVQAVVRAQLQAIAAVSGSHDVRLLLPYLVRHEELQHWMQRVRQEVPVSVPIGAMVETPAGALDIAHWSDVADFVAVGCNDLMQCLFAADRDNPEVAAYLDPYAPVLYRFFRDLSDRAGDRRADIQLCGVLPQLNGVLPILLGLGYRTFSVDAGQIPYLAESVRTCSMAAARALAAEVCAQRDSLPVLELLRLPTTRGRPFCA